MNFVRYVSQKRGSGKRWRGVFPRLPIGRPVPIFVLTAHIRHGRFRLLALHHSICLRLRDILISHLLSTSQSQHSTSTDSKLTKQHKSFRYQNTNMSPSKSSTASSVPSSSQLKVVDKNQEVPIFLRSKYSTVPNQCRSD